MDYQGTGTYQHRALLTNQQRCAEGVASDVVRADRQVRYLEVLDTVDIESLVEHTVLDDVVTLSRCHGAGTKRMPSCLNVTLNPLLNVGNVFFGVL